MKRAIIGLLVIFVLCIQAQDIAKVNGKKISLKFLEQELEKLPLVLQENYIEDYPGFLEELINQELVLQEALRQKLDTLKEIKNRIEKNKEIRNIILMDELLNREIRTDIKVSEDEALKYFKENKEKMKGSTFQQRKSEIQQTLTDQRQVSAIQKYFSALRSKAKISYNQKWLKAEEEKMNNPVKQALKNKLPTMAEFGSGTCQPCVQMKPIIQELQKDYRNKVNILSIDVDDYIALTRKYRIVLIPTQIFYDTLGNETFRHMGFFSKDSILIQLKKAGLK
jgi:thioredoxin 1